MSSDEAATRRRAPPKAKAKAKVKVASKDDREKAKKANQPIVSQAKKDFRLLDACMKEGRKAVRNPHCHEDLKNAVAACKDLMKETKRILDKHAAETKQGKYLEAASMDAKSVKDLCKSVMQQSQTVNNLQKAMNDMGEQHIEAILEKRKANGQKPSVDVD